MRHILILATMLVLAGCGGSADPVGTSPDTAASLPTTTRTPTSTTTSTTTPTPTPVDKDCADCPRIAAGQPVPLPPGTGATLRVSAVRGGEVTFEGDVAGRLQCLTICGMTSTGAGTTIKLSAPGALIADKVRVDVLAIEAGKAVLKVAQV